MEFKILNRLNRILLKSSGSAGVTIVELILVMAFILILISISILLINPWEHQAKARDQKRFGELNTMDMAISQFNMENGRYPTLEELTSYMGRLPQDPINDAEYRYIYVMVDNRYELNVRLEYYHEKAQQDGGNDPQLYEISND